MKKPAKPARLKHQPATMQSPSRRRPIRRPRKWTRSNMNKTYFAPFSTICRASFSARTRTGGTCSPIGRTSACWAPPRRRFSEKRLLISILPSWPGNISRKKFKSCAPGNRCRPRKNWLCTTRRASSGGISQAGSRSRTKAATSPAYWASVMTSPNASGRRWSFSATPRNWPRSTP